MNLRQLELRAEAERRNTVEQPFLPIDSTLKMDNPEENTLFGLVIVSIFQKNKSDFTSLKWFKSSRRRTPTKELNCDFQKKKRISSLCFAVVTFFH